MTETSHLLPLSLALSAALLLGACSRDAPAPAQSPSGKAGATAVGKVAVARGIIDVEGGLIALAPPVDGSITAAPVKEGATVKKGQLLLSLDGALLQQEVAMATADLALANDRLKGSQAQLRELERNATRLSTGPAKACRPTSRPMRPSSSWLAYAPMLTWPVRRSTWPSTSWNTPG